MKKEFGFPKTKVVPSPEVCVKCKGRLWCGPTCFIMERQERAQQALKTVFLNSNEVQSKTPPGVFVSWHSYPKVTFSPMAPALPVDESLSGISDDTDKWFGLKAEKIINFRENLVRGNMFFSAKAAANPDYKLVEVQETLMAKRPVEVEMKLREAPRVRNLSFSDFHAPMGPQAELKNFSAQQNATPNQKIEKFFYDTDAKSLEAMVELFKSEVGVNQLHKILSAGMLGIGKNRKLVPTRWSITAIDSNLSEYFIDEKIKYFPQISETLLFHSTYLENYYYIILLPREWGFELLEAYKPGASWNLESKEPTFMADFEFFEGRSNYAENTAGGYYAARIAVAEYLLREKKQATALVFREIGDAGTPSLGVWKCRQTARDALQKKPLNFSDLNLALKYLETKLAIPLKFWKKKSRLLDEIFYQKKLSDFN